MTIIRANSCCLLLFILVAIAAIFPSCRNDDNVVQSRRSVPTITCAIGFDTAGIVTMLKSADSVLQIRPSVAYRAYDSILKISEDIHYLTGQVKSLIGKSSAEVGMGNYESALKNLNKGLLICKEDSKKHKLRSLLLSNIGTVYDNQGKYEEAMNYYFNAAAISKQYNDSSELPRIYSNLGSVLMNIKQYPKALNYFQQGIIFAIPTKQYRILGYLYLNKAGTFNRMGSIDSALESSRLAMKYGILSDNSDLKQLVHVKYGDNLIDIGRYNEAINYYKLALSFSTDTNSRGNAIANKQLGNVYMHELKNFNQAEIYLNRALRASILSSPLRITMLLESDLAELYKLKKDYQSSLQHLESYQDLKDSILNEESLRAVNNLEAKYKTAEKDKDLAEKRLTIAYQKSNITRKNFTIVIILAAIFLGGAFLFLYYRYQKRLEKKHNELIAWQSMMKGEEKERTRIARELHDGIGGMLSTVSMYFGTIQKQRHELYDDNDFNQAMQLLHGTLKEVRQAAHNLMPELLLRHGFPDAVRIFCVSLSKDKGLQVDFQYYGFIDRFNNSIELALYRMVQELVHNVQKHARADHLLVQLSQHDDMLSITIEDNGVGIIDESARDNGIGLSNIERSVKELNGTFSITSSEGNGTTVYMELNLQSVKSLVV